MRAALLVAALVSLAACGGGSRSPVSPTPTPQPVIIAGTLRATNGQAVIAGATIRAASGESVTTDAAGTFRLSLLSTPARFTITGAIVPREVSVSSHDVALDAFVENGSFDLAYFRQIARGALDNAALQPIRRWTQAPRVYLRTIDESGAAIDPKTLDMVATTLTATAASWTAGAIGVASVERGTDTRIGQAGWITVRWTPDAAAYCGRADVGMSGGMIEFAPKGANCACGGFQMAPRIVKHELGHALGWWHSPDPADLMHVSSAQCDRDLSARERQYARYLYARPVGNVDPDSDPVGTVLLQPAMIVH